MLQWVMEWLINGFCLVVMGLYLPVTDEMETLAEPEIGSALSSATHSTLLEQVDGVDFILKDVSELNADSKTLTSVAIQ